MSKYTFTTDWWFLTSDLKKHIFWNIDQTKENRILEIGSFEGCSSCFFSDYFLEHPSSFLHCVDPFSLSDTTTVLSTSTEQMFRTNISNSKQFEKIKVYKMYSDEYFSSVQVPLFTFIYIDGSHEPEQIYKDLRNAFRHLESGCIMWMDDYMANPNIKQVMDEFVSEYSSNVNLIHLGYQLALRKV